jgi:hypothetical protein
MASLLQFVLKCAGLLIGIEAPQTRYFKVDMVIVYNHFHVLFIPMRNAALHDPSRPEEVNPCDGFAASYRLIPILPIAFSPGYE